MDINQAEWFWAIGLLTVFPLAMLTLSEMVQQGRRKNSPLAVLAAHVRSLVLPPLAVYLLLTQVAGLPGDHVYARLGLTVLLIGVLYATLSLFKTILFVESTAGSWQRRLPRILTDLIRLALVLIGSVFVLSVVWGHNLGQMLTALGVGSIVIGLALQEPLGNVFSGIFLLVERPVEVGDWIEIDGNRGQVTEINWRSVHLTSRWKELIVIPNSVLAQGRFKNFSRPETNVVKTIKVGFSFDDPPNEVKSILQEIVKQTPGILQEPPPTVRTSAFGDYAIEYLISFCLPDYLQQFEVADELMSRLWYAARRHRLTIPYPIHTEIHETATGLAQRNRQLTHSQLTSPLETLGLNHSAELVRRLDQVSLRSYGQGEVVVEQGSELEGLQLIVRGQAKMVVRDAAGRQRQLGHLNPGEFFGERALLSRNTSELTVEATKDLEILVLDGELLNTALESSPRLVREIGNVIEARKRELLGALRGEADVRAA